MINSEKNKLHPFFLAAITMAKVNEFMGEIKRESDVFDSKVEVGL